jgi:PPE-repeat protein
MPHRARLALLVLSATAIIAACGGASGYADSTPCSTYANAPVGDTSSTNKMQAYLVSKSGQSNTYSQEIDDLTNGMNTECITCNRNQTLGQAYAVVKAEYDSDPSALEQSSSFSTITGICTSSGSGNTGSGTSGAANTGSGSTGAGSTGAGSTGNSGSGSTGAGNTGAGNTGAASTGTGNTGTGNTGQTWPPGTSASNPYCADGLCGYPEPASGLCLAGYHARDDGCYKGAIEQNP